MIPFDIVYFRPDSLEEAVEAWRAAPEGSLYYSGGTEIVTGCRSGTYRPAAVIDLKRIPELRSHGAVGARLFFGAALSLNEAAEAGGFPLLSAAAKKIADRTVRNRITLGGNVAGRLPFREALLPFLAADGRAHLAGPAAGGGVERRELPVRELHSKRLQLRPGEFLVGLSVDGEAAAAACAHERSTAGASVDYPILALCAVAMKGLVSVAVSGVHDYPLWADSSAGPLAVESLPTPKNDHRASAEYRAELLRAALSRVQEALS